MIRKLFLVLLGFVPTMAPAQPTVPRNPLANLPAGTIWVESDRSYASVPARISFPRAAGPIAATGSRDLRPDSGGSDSTLQYRSADGAIIGTVYLYYPGLSRTGLAAFATDGALRENSRTPVAGGPHRRGEDADPARGRG